MQTRKNDISGFTLLEILVALAILGIVLTTGLDLLSGAMTSAAVSREYAQATEAASRELTYILTRSDFFENEDWPEGGSFENGAVWTFTATPYEGPGWEDTDRPLPFTTYLCRLRVEWESGKQIRHLELTALKTIQKPRERGETRNRG